jgi:hypothetical protein
MKLSTCFLVTYSPTIRRRKSYRVNRHFLDSDIFRNISNPYRTKKKAREHLVFPDFVFMVGVAGFEALKTLQETQ